jgi:hypothetical protein
MTTEKQIEANRRNALKSTGPKSDQAKTRTRMNSLRHGLTAEQAVLPHEDPHDYDEIRSGMLDAHAPRDSAELSLVEELANAYWRLLRLHRVENQYWEHLGGSYNRGDEGIAEALIQSPDKQTRAFFRYYGQIEKSYYRALTAVNHIKRDKGKGKSVTQDASAAAATPNGFVSQKAEEPLGTATVTERLPDIPEPFGSGFAGLRSVGSDACYSEGVLIEARVP